MSTVSLSGEGWLLDDVYASVSHEQDVDRQRWSQSSASENDQLPIGEG